MSLKFGQIQPSSVELAAIERLKKNPHTLTMGKLCCHLFSAAAVLNQTRFILAGSDDTHKLDDFKNWEDPTAEHTVICP